MKKYFTIITLFIFVFSTLIFFSRNGIHDFILSKINSAKEKAERIQLSSQANQRLLEEQLKNIDNTSFTPLTFISPNFASPIVYDAAWETFTYESKNKRFPSFSFKYPSLLGKPNVTDLQVSKENDELGGSFFVVFHSDVSDDKTPYVWSMDSSLKKMEIRFNSTYNFSDKSYDQTLPILEKVTKAWQDQGMSPAYYFNVDGFTATGLRAKLDNYYQTQFEIDISKDKNQELFEVTIFDGNSGSKVSYTADYDVEGLSIADKITASVTFKKEELYLNPISAVSKLTQENATPAPFDFKDSKGKLWHIVDFYIFNGPGKRQYYLGRKITDPVTKKEVTNTTTGKYAYVTEDLSNLAPVKNVDLGTGIINYSFTEETAVNAAIKALTLAPEYSVSTSTLKEAESGYYYLVEFIRYDPFVKRFFWGQHAVVDPYTGEIITDSKTLRDLHAQVTDIPEGFNPKTKEQILSEQNKSLSKDFYSVLKSPFALSLATLLALVVIAVSIFLRHTKRRASIKKIVDFTFGTAAVIQFFFAMYLFRYSDDTTTWIWILTTAMGTMTSWASYRMFYAQGPKVDGEDEILFTPMNKGDVKNVGWASLIVNNETLSELKRAVGLIEHPEITTQLGIDPPKGILLYGPPGTGKTTIAKVIANEARAAFFSISLADIYSMWLGQSEKQVHSLFQEARKHRPSIIFIDEIDSLMNRRGGSSSNFSDKIANQVLQEIDGVKDSNYVFVVGATNAPDLIDPALLRGGRLSSQIEIPLPEIPEREKLFSLFLKKVSLDNDINLNILAQKTASLSGADIKDICEKAIVLSFERTKNAKITLSQKDLLESISGYARTSRIYHVPESFKKHSVDNFIQDPDV